MNFRGMFNIFPNTTTTTTPTTPIAIETPETKSTDEQTEIPVEQALIPVEQAPIQPVEEGGGDEEYKDIEEKESDESYSVTTLSTGTVHVLYILCIL
jgi:hypothetical protein